MARAELSGAMTGIIIAAGRGARMGPLTATRPKCLLPVFGKPLIDHSIARLRAAGCDRIAVVTGYRASAIERHVGGLRDVECIRNERAAETNVLQSFAVAHAMLDGPCIVTYSDTLVTSTVYDQLMSTPGDIVLAADTDWQAYYEGRTGHPLGEAEKVYFDVRGSVRRIGKHLAASSHCSPFVGEFPGLLRLSTSGCAQLRSLLEDLLAVMTRHSPFQAAAFWDHAYLTDLLQEAIDRGLTVTAAPVRRGWAELDTRFDYDRLPSLANAHALDVF
jgi:L-glutamine-phosphate cytidylyltransferase